MTKTTKTKLPKMHPCVVCNTVNYTKQMGEMYRENDLPKFACADRCFGSARGVELRRFAAELDAKREHNLREIARARAGEISFDNIEWK